MPRFFGAFSFFTCWFTACTLACKRKFKVTVFYNEYLLAFLQGSWKDWEMNTMDNMKTWVADTITVYHSDNSNKDKKTDLLLQFDRAKRKL